MLPMFFMQTLTMWVCVNDADASLMAGQVMLEHATAANDVAQGLKDLDVHPESFVSPQCAQQVRPPPCFFSAGFLLEVLNALQQLQGQLLFVILRVRGAEHAWFTQGSCKLTDRCVLAVQVSWAVGEHQEATPPFADITGQNRQPSQPAASDDLFFAKSNVTSASKSPVQSPPGHAAVSSQHLEGVLSPAMAASPSPTGHAHSSPRLLPAIQELDLEGAPQDCSDPHQGADGGADQQPHRMQAFAGRPGAARELLWSQPHQDKGTAACCQPECGPAAAPKRSASPAPARNRHAGVNNDRNGEAAKKEGAVRKGRDRSAGRAACQSPPPKPRRNASTMVCSVLSVAFCHNTFAAFP